MTHWKAGKSMKQDQNNAASVNLAWMGVVGIAIPIAAGTLALALKPATANLIMEGGLILCGFLLGYQAVKSVHNAFKKNQTDKEQALIEAALSSQAPLPQEGFMQNDVKNEALNSFEHAIGSKMGISQEVLKDEKRLKGWQAHNTK